MDSIDSSKLGAGLGVLGCGLVLRIIATRLVLKGSDLTNQEARLVCIAWLPKATVQAAVGGTALDLVREKGYGAEAEARGQLVLMLSVLVILLTAPIGALGIAMFGPVWLSHDQDTATDQGRGATQASEAERGGENKEAPLSSTMSNAAVPVGFTQDIQQLALGASEPAIDKL